MCGCRAARPGMLLLDIHLAGVMDGWDLLLGLKQDESLQHIPIVVMVGSDPDVHGLAMGGADYALKSASREALVQAVHRQISDLHGKHILVADDDSVFRARIAHFLRSEQAWVEEAENGTTALERMAGRIPDLLILDLLMPGMDGFEILRRLQQDRTADYGAELVRVLDCAVARIKQLRTRIRRPVLQPRRFVLLDSAGAREKIKS